jgi:hypothetical protein
MIAGGAAVVCATAGTATNAAPTSTIPKVLKCMITSRTHLLARYEAEKIAKPAFLITSQMPGFRKNSFDQAFRLLPISAQAGAYKTLSGGSPRTVGGDDICKDRREFVDHLLTAL